MNSRLTVSVLFVLFAVTTLGPVGSNVIQKLTTLEHSWAGEAFDCCSAEMLNRISARVSALKIEFRCRKSRVTLIRAYGHRQDLARRCAPENHLRRVGELSPDGTTITSGVPRDANVPSSQAKGSQIRFMNPIHSVRHTVAFERATRAVRQIHEVLDLMRTK